MSKQDRQGVRTPAGLEQKYNFEQRFDDAMAAAEEAKTATSKLDRQLTQEEIFNRLTNGGKAKGVFMDKNGEIYINASFLTTGILKSLDGKTFYLDLVKGILKGQFSQFSIAGKSVEQIAEDKASQAAGSAVAKQTQKDIYNKLTGNGKAQGIFYENGQLYINASYLVAGILKSLDGTTFYLDLVNGILRGNFTELYIEGKRVSWKDNGDGTFTLIGQ